ncbi:MAG: aromatic ring-hydroxylating dioxygenase subunit alpha [Leptolyngbya sp. SIO1D8]|nr:aromatic ring-hydroxylating dioxygenase subunit alpha [Leptolyngbya sp. SIO1D8]
MFSAENQFFLRNTWYFAMPSQHLKPGKMVGKTLLNEPILLGRTKTGKAFAIGDLCPHRGVPLSGGWFNGESVQCCYHGWRFNAQGHCVEIPSLMEDQQMDLSRFNVKCYDVQEVQGNLWIYLPDPDPSKARPPRFEIPRVPGFPETVKPKLTYTMQVSCYMDNAVLGLMDPAHAPYVHQSWWWRNSTLHPEVKWFDPSPCGFTMRRHKMANMGRGYWLIGGIPENEIVFHLPGVRTEETTTAKHRVVNFIAITPISEEQTEFTFEFYWDLPWGWLLKPFLVPLTKSFLAQDREVLIKQHAGLKHQPVLRLVKDADVLIRWYYQLKAEYQRSQTEDREFISPVKTQQLRWMA